jgi:HPt (histidine-containing phosphotransfer) domain-containing protein
MSDLAGMPAVDNATAAGTPAPAAPEPVNTAPAPEPEGTPAVPTQVTPQFEPGDRGLNVLHAILDLPEGADPASLFKAPAAATPPQGTPAAPTAPPATPAPTPSPVTEPQVTIPDKFKNPDGTVNVAAIVKSYTELEKSFGEQGNKFGQQIQQLQTQIAQAQQQPAQPAQPATPPAQPATPPAPAPEAPKFPWEAEMTPEEKERLERERYEDPDGYEDRRDQQIIKAMEHRFQQTLEKVLAPLAPVIETHQQQAEVQTYTTRLQEFAKDNQDLPELLPEMQKLSDQIGPVALKAMEQAGQDSIKFLYDSLKAFKAPPAPPTPTVDELINNPEYRQKILSDPNIKNEILKTQVSAVQAGAPPPVIGAQPGGVPPSAPAEHVKSSKEAGRAVARFFGLGG